MTTVTLAVAIVALVIALWLAIQVVRLRAIVATVPKDGGVIESLRRIDADLAAAETAIADMAPRLDEAEATLPYAIQHTAVVAYDAFDDIAGNLSRSIALLNGRGDGIVVSLLVSRDETHWFTKQVRGGGGSEPLSPEEKAAVRRALGG